MDEQSVLVNEIDADSVTPRNLADPQQKSEFKEAAQSNAGVTSKNAGSEQAAMPEPSQSQASIALVSSQNTLSHVNSQKV